ncbi:Putative oxidoreductase CatD [Tritonibacter multivorans]|uniref:Putative oxidoreductase CatD n=1 Tax=Tritonibacter multivorans TaxID=928856 RepID=A0A0P1GAW1_9RHOB|nr:DoxX family protein [Tritonibacter multivorans]MDA7422016.1 DoxX family protein [Tritonibacter multivorans]CUH78654.1 Putative oxidoreductase CatD [Tritonibacter multivorans]SFD66575.1 putative oxidoreductase [Tritonibacter multivorans]
MLDHKTAPYAALALRVASGVTFIAHGLLKVLVFTPAGTAGFFQSLGLPGPLAYATIAAELLGGLALVLGFQTRLVALGLIPILLGAVFFAHGGNGWVFSNEGGGWEFPMFWAVTNLVIAGLGSGAFALDLSSWAKSKNLAAS